MKKKEYRSPIMKVKVAEPAGKIHIIHERIENIGKNREIIDNRNGNDTEFDNIIDCRIDESGSAHISTDLIETARNSSNTVSVSFKERGDYKLSMRVRSNATSDLAQIPLSIFRDKELVKMVTLTGADKDWQNVEVVFENCAMTFFMRLYFAQDGMEIDDITISLAKSKEEEFRLMFARMGEQ